MVRFTSLWGSGDQLAQGTPPPKEIFGAHVTFLKILPPVQQAGGLPAISRGSSASDTPGDVESIHTPAGGMALT